MCIKGKKGVLLKKPNNLINKFEYFFGEDQGRYIIEIKEDDFKSVTEILEKSSVHYDNLGTVKKNELIIDDKSKVTIDELIKSHTSWLTNYMNK
jgi:phosphoribosylformylglycinamidine (FGAM) synthase-like enzyme